MHTSYGGMLRILFEHLFGPVHYPAEAAERIRALAKEGMVVYVARGCNSWLVLYFNYALARIGLPLARFVGGLSLLLWQPVDRLWKLWRQRRRPIVGPWRRRFKDRQPTRSEALLAGFAQRCETAFLALSSRSESQRHDYIRALVAVQRNLDRPIHLIPHVLTDRAQGGPGSAGLRPRAFGDRHSRGRLRQLAMFLSSSRRATVRVADPVNLKEVCNEFPDLDDAKLARRVRHDLNHRISEEERVVAGPARKQYSATARHIMRDPVFRATLEAQAEETGRSVASLERQARSQLKEIASRYTPRMIRVLDVIVSWVFSRIYDGVFVDEVGLARVIEAARKGPLVFCPSHKSHIDYLVLSLLVWKHGIAPPHIAAGANLSFFPLGPIFRRAGAFFLRRSFKGDVLYRAVLEAYVTELVREGTDVEIFLEGTRSRGGKVSTPKLGILSMVVQAWRRGAREDVLFVPISIDYERIIEAGAYERELRGGSKRPEDIRGLLDATRVLSSRYGRVHLQFGEPMSLCEFAEKRDLPRNPSVALDDRWRKGIQRLAYRVMREVSTVCSVTPTSVVATALLGYQNRGMSQSTLLELSNEVIEFLYDSLARLSSALQSPDNRSYAVLQAAQKLVEEGTLRVDRAGRADNEAIYRVPEEQRIILDFHKNAVMNYFAQASLVCRALRRRGFGSVPYADVHADTRFVSKLFKREFIYRVDVDYDTVLDETLAGLAVRGFLDVHESGQIEVRDQRSIALLAGLLDAFVEAYWVAASTLRDLRDFPLWDRELSTRALERARRAYLEGNITRPESASRTLVQTALQWFAEEGVVDETPAGRRKSLQLSAKYAGEGLDRLVAEISEFL